MVELALSGARGPGSPEPELRFRRPGEADHPRVVGVLDEWFSRRVRHRLPRLWFVHFAATSWLAEARDGRLTGILVGYLSPGRPEEAVVHLLASSPNLRRHGVARALLERFESDARTAGRVRLTIDVPPDDRRAVDFLRVVGFAPRSDAGTVPIYGVPAYPDYDAEGEDRAIFDRPVSRS